MIKMVSVALSGSVSVTIQSIIVLPPTGSRHFGRLFVYGRMRSPLPTTGKMAFIYFLFIFRVFKPIAESFGVAWSSIEGRWKNIDNFARQLATSKNKIDIKKEIDDFLESIPETMLSRGSSEKIEEIVKFSSGWSSVKKVGKRAFTGSVYTDYNAVEDECKSHGLLIVPVGELEHFYKPFETLHGPKWTNKVLESVDLLNDSDLRDAREFVHSILEF